MGYATRVTGAITITPPIPWSEVKDSPFVKPKGEYGNDRREVQFHIVEEIVETEDGTLTRRHADAVIPAWEDPYRAYDIEAHLRELVSAYSGNGRRFSGYLSGEGEDNDDMWRLRVRDGRVELIKPRIVWPDGEDES